MGIWPSGRYCVGWGIIGFLALLSGIVSSRVDMVVFGAVFSFAAASTYLTFYVKSEYRLKRALEVIFMLLALGSVIYGYVATGSLILGVVTLFIVALVIVAFVLSYLLPNIREQELTKRLQKTDFSVPLRKRFPFRYMVVKALIDAHATQHNVM